MIELIEDDVSFINIASSLFSTDVVGNIGLIIGNIGLIV